MTTAPRFSLWPACVRGHAFEQQLQAAQAAGFNRLPIGPCHLPAIARVRYDRSRHLRDGG